jgi:hypothetical protein
MPHIVITEWYVAGVMHRSLGSVHIALRSGMKIGPGLRDRLVAAQVTSLCTSPVRVPLWTTGMRHQGTVTRHDLDPTDEFRPLVLSVGGRVSY